MWEAEVVAATSACRAGAATPRRPGGAGAATPGRLGHGNAAPPPRLGGSAASTAFQLPRAAKPSAAANPNRRRIPTLRVPANAAGRAILLWLRGSGYGLRFEDGGPEGPPYDYV